MVLFSKTENTEMRGFMEEINPSVLAMLFANGGDTQKQQENQWVSSWSLDLGKRED